MKTPDFSYELAQIPPSCRYLLGIDEVGRGPWAGPVTICAFLLDLQSFNHDDFVKLGVRDSKTLSPLKRQKLFSYFQDHHFPHLIFSASSSQIDQKGIGLTIKGLILFALKKFRSSFDYCLIDGNYSFQPHPDIFTSSQIRSLPKADQSCFSVASASICAKVTRDSAMDHFDDLYPQYGFKNHKGYGTAEHLTALKLHGPCPIHRRSFKPVNLL
jgi:ribonuclease HII